MTNHYATEVDTWRAQEETKLRAENGWLAVSGLLWLREGPNTFGTAESNDIILPPNSTVPHAGVFVLSEGSTTVEMNNGVEALINAKPLPPGRTRMQSDEAPAPDRLSLNAMSMMVLKRGVRHAIRLWDNHSDARRDFAGRKWFPIDEAWCLNARFMPYASPKPLTILNMLGDLEPANSPGIVTFAVAGVSYSLEAEGDLPEKRLFFNFRDATNGRQTYGAGRFLTTSGVVNGYVNVDFNKAVSPPCAFTPYATCPLPRNENILSIAVPVGELASFHY